MGLTEYSIMLTIVNNDNLVILTSDDEDEALDTMNTLMGMLRDESIKILKTDNFIIPKDRILYVQLVENQVTLS